MRNVNSRELATILAALRHFQSSFRPTSAARDGFEQFADCEPLNADEIDGLCERINTEPDITGPHLTVYFAPEWKDRDGKGYCVDLDYPEVPGSDGHRFASAQAAGGFVAGRLVELAKRE